jgi:hypothetical protein
MSGNPLSGVDPDGLLDKQGSPLTAGQIVNCSDVPIRIWFDKDEGGKRHVYYLDLPPGYTSTYLVDVDWAYCGKTRNGVPRWQHIYPPFKNEVDTEVYRGHRKQHYRYIHFGRYGLLGKGRYVIEYGPYPGSLPGTDPIERMPVSRAIGEGLIETTQTECHYGLISPHTRYRTTWGP